MIGSFTYLKNRIIVNLEGLTPTANYLLAGTGSAWTTTNSPTLAGLDLTGITNGCIPYMSASGFADSLLTHDETHKRIGINNTGPTTILDIITDETKTLGTITSNPGVGLKVRSSVDADGNVMALSLGPANTAGTLQYGFWVVESITAGYSPNMYLGRRTGSGTSTISFAMMSDGKTGFSGETDPITAMEITRTDPYITLHNSTHENGDGGRESRIIARGEQDGTEESVLGWLEFSHDGTGDDEKGQFTIMLNDGDDDTTPSITGLNIDSSGITSVRNLYPQADDTYCLGKNDDDTPFGWKGLILKDTTNGKHYRIQLTNGAVDIVDLTD